MLRPSSLERRIFAWLATLSVLPALAVLVVSLFLGSRSVGWLGTLGPWSRVADSGLALIEAVERVPADTSLAAAAARHRGELSASLQQANRWHFLGERLLAVAPAFAAVLALGLIVLALVLSRRLAKQIARPVADLVDWSGRLGRGEPLPPDRGNEDREVSEVRALRGALRQAAAEIETGRRRELELQRTRAWGEMARRVAHEMKNPLTPLRLATHRLERGLNGSPPLREALAVIQQETDRLDELAQAFAQLGRPVSGPQSEIELSELFERLLETDVPGQIHRQLVVAPGTHAVLGHYDALQRAFRNLVRNAVEAIESGGRTPGEIEVRVGNLGADRVEVRIADNGPGIPAGYEEVIFEPDRTFKAKGTGLGLAIVRQVTATHGGSVRARSRETGGAEFVVELPVSSERATAQTPRG